MSLPRTDLTDIFRNRFSGTIRDYSLRREESCTYLQQTYHENYNLQFNSLICKEIIISQYSICPTQQSAVVK